MAFSKKQLINTQKINDYTSNVKNMIKKKKTLIVFFSVVLLLITIVFSIHQNGFITNKIIFDSAIISDSENYKLIYKKPKVKNKPVYDIARITNVNSFFTSKSNYKLGGLNYKISFLIKNKSKKPVIIKLSHSYVGKKKYFDLKNYFTEYNSDNYKGFDNVYSKYNLGYYPSNNTKLYSLNPLETKKYSITGSINFKESITEYDRYYQQPINLIGKIFKRIENLLKNESKNTSYEKKTDYGKRSYNDSVKYGLSDLKKIIENKFNVSLSNYFHNEEYIKKQFKNAKTLDEKYQVIKATSISYQKKLRKKLIGSLLLETTNLEDLERFVAYEKEFRKMYNDVTIKAVNEHYKIYKQMNMIEGYKFFIKHFSSYDIATVAISDMHKRGFVLARKIDTKEGYDSYLSLFPYSNKNKEISLLANELEKKEIKKKLDSNWIKSLFTGEEDKRNKREVMANKLFVSARKNEGRSNVHVTNRKYSIILNYFDDTEVASRVIDDQERKVTLKLEQERFNIISEKITTVSNEIRSQTSKSSKKLNTTINVLKNNREIIKHSITSNSSYIREQISLNRDVLPSQLTHMESMKEQTQYLYNAREEQEALRAKRIEKIFKKSHMQKEADNTTAKK